jgi:hypothetical protein
MKLIYLPAINRCALRTNWGITPLNWMDPRLEGTRAFHPFALTSHWYWWKQRFAWEPDDWIFGDSGGYSALTLGVDIDPRHVMRWQVKFCNVGVILDTPPWPKRRDDQPGFKECLARTVAATRAALPIYRRALDAGTQFRWWGVVHGRTPAELEQWWRAIRRVYPFKADGEGLAFKPFPTNDPVGMADVLEFIADKGIRRAHFFATAGRYALETLCCLGPKRGLELATFDSTTATLHGNYRRLLVRTPYGREQVRGEAAVRRHMVEECGCVSCDFLRQDVQECADLIVDDYWRFRMIFHNVLVMLDEFASLQGQYGSSGNRHGSRTEAPGRASTAS